MDRTPLRREQFLLKGRKGGLSEGNEPPKLAAIAGGPKEFGGGKISLCQDFAPIEKEGIKTPETMPNIT